MAEAMFNRKWLTFKLSTLFLALTVAAVACAYPHIRRQIQFHRFKSFVGQDIRTLPESQRESFATIITDLTPDRPTRWEALLNRRENWFVWKVLTRHGVRFVLFQAEPTWNHPGNDVAHVYLFDDWGRMVGRSSFSTGRRIGIDNAALVTDKLDGEVVIAVEASRSVRERGAKQYYGILDERLVLLRLEDNRGAYIPDEMYFASIGPKEIPRSEAEWMRALADSRATETLSALLWLGRRHRSQFWNSRFEDSDGGTAYLNVRNHPDTKPAVDALTRHANPWISEAARQTMRSLQQEP